MIARLVLLAGLALLAGCVALPEDSQRAALVVAAPDADAPPTDPAGSASAASTVTPVHAETRNRVSSDRNAAARAACLADGGTFTGSDLGGYTCVQRTRDANRICTASNQCQGLCLSRSGTCSPVTPLLGCIDIFDDNGDPAIVCLN